MNDEPSRARPVESGEIADGQDSHARGEGGEGARNAESTPKLGDATKPGQTGVPAPDDDVGVPPDAEMNRDTSEENRE